MRPQPNMPFSNPHELYRKEKRAGDRQRSQLKEEARQSRKEYSRKDK